MENKNIVMRIKILIEHENVSPSKFAKMIDFNQSNLSKILKGDRNVAPNLINAICDNLNVSYKWLVNGEGSMFLTEPSNAQPIKTYINDELIEVPIVDADAAATFIENMYDQHYNIDKYGVMQEEGEDLNSGEYVVFKVVGESMVPTIPDNAKVLAMRIPEERWEELSGVVFVVYGNS